MNPVFNQIETGHYVAYSVVFNKSPCNTSLIFPNEEDAILYADALCEWWYVMHPFARACGWLCAENNAVAKVKREILLFDGVLMHSLGENRWPLDRISETVSKFNEWKTDDKRDPMDLARILRLPTKN